MRSRILALGLLLLVACTDEDGARPGDPSPVADAGTDAPPDAGGCQPGEVPAPDGSCEPAGVPPARCGAGFEADGRRGCVAILPSDPCGEGTLAIPGETSCHPLAPCAPGPWGDIPVDATTQYVDGTFAGESYGTAEAPWTTVGDAVQAAASGAIVAIAEGDYLEDVFVQGKPVRLWGRCPDLVRIVGTGDDLAAIYVRLDADGTEIRDLAVAGDAVGVLVTGSTDVVLDRVWIVDTASRGLNVQDSLGETTVTVTRSLVERAGQNAVFAAGGALLLEASAFRDTQPVATGGFGRGFSIQEGDTGARATVALRSSILERNSEISIFLGGSDMTVDSSLVRDTLGSAVDSFGKGIEITTSPVSGQRATLAITASVIERSQLLGVVAHGSDLTLDASVVRDTAPRAEDGRYGRGIAVQYDIGPAARSRLALTASVVERNHEAGVLVLGSDADIEGTIVRDGQPNDDFPAAWGVNFQVDPPTTVPSAGALRWSVVENNVEAGVAVVGADVTIEGTLVRNTAPRSTDGNLGDGVVVLRYDLGAVASIERSRIESSARAGVLAAGSSVRITDTVLECNPISLDAETVDGEPSSFEDLGDNVCGCAGETVLCQVATSNLEPPVPLP